MATEDAKKDDPRSRATAEPPRLLEQERVESPDRDGSRPAAEAELIAQVTKPPEELAEEETPIPTPVQVPAGIAQRTPSVQGLLDLHRDGAPVTAGAVVAELLSGHPGYLDEFPADLALAGAVRTVAEHVEWAALHWDPATTSTLRARHVALGLALDPAVGWPLVRSGAVHALIERWQPIRRQHREPVALIWDLLTDAGRAAADEQPLLAAALGAPAEWSATLPHDVTALAWSPDGEQVAVLAGDVVHRCARGAEPARIGTAGPGVTGLGWGRSGVVALSVGGGNASLTRLPDGQVLGTMSGVSDARITGDGSGAWVQTSSGLLRWSHANTSPVPLDAPSLSSAESSSASPEPGHPLTVDHSGSAGVIEHSGNLTLLSGIPDTGQPNWGRPALSDPDDGTSALPEQASTGALAIPIGSRPPGACALVAMGRRRAVARAETAGVVVEQVPFPPLARIASGPATATALAADPTGTRLAVAIGPRVEVWTLSQGRASADGVPRYDSDRAEGPDLLEADRDARAIAGLMASQQLKPPLAIGLFGPWGSGKSFVISRIKHFLGQFTGGERTRGYLGAVRVIDFNAWNYAEANIWASMVDQVFTDLQQVDGVPAPKPAPEVVDAKAQAEKAERQADQTDRDVQAAERELHEARVQLTWRRVTAVSLALLVLGLVVATLVVGTARMLAFVTSAVALLGLAAGFIDHARRVWGQARDVVDTGRTGWRAMAQVIGRPEAAAVRTKGEELQRRQEKQAAARQEADRLADEAARVEALASTQPLGSLIRQLSTVTAYRDELGLVTRTKEYFGEINRRITESRKQRERREGGGVPAATAEATTDVSVGETTGGAGDRGSAAAQEDVPLDRIIILIDDLDRCAPEKVVTVLEAVHLLFDFEMFVVLIAVDTRWLEQSLRIRYRQLLGRANTAAPSDYLEKIIQVPLHLLPLEAALVRTMIANLTGTSLDTGDPGDGLGPGSGAVGGPVSRAAPAAAMDGEAAQHPRPHRPALPAEVLRITPAEATAMSVVAPLVGSTPRTVKRFVNTFQLLKARVADPSGFDAPRDGLGDHEVVAFLLALVTGHPVVGSQMLPALRGRAPGLTVQAALNTIVLPVDAAAAQVASLAAVRAWLPAHQKLANARADRFADWAAEVGRFSFTPPGVADPPGAS